MSRREFVFAWFAVAAACRSTTEPQSTAAPTIPGWLWSPTRADFLAVRPETVDGIAGHRIRLARAPSSPSANDIMIREWFVA